MCGTASSDRRGSLRFEPTTCAGCHSQACWRRWLKDRARRAARDTAAPRRRLGHAFHGSLLLAVLLASAGVACGVPSSAPPGPASSTASVGAQTQASPSASPSGGAAAPAGLSQTPPPAPQTGPVQATPAPQSGPGQATPQQPRPSPGSSPNASPAASASAAPAAQTYPLSLTDDLGRGITLPTQPMRIATLQPSATEIVCAIDACSRVVATDDFSDYPPEVTTKPRLGGLGMSAEGVIAARPELVVTDAGTRAELIEQLARAGVPVLVTDAKTFDDVVRSIELVGRAVGAAETAARVTSEMRSRVQAVRAKTADVDRRPRVLHELDATDPNRPFVVGPRTFIDELITLAGGTNALANSPVAYPQISTEQVIAADPEIITLGDAAFGVSVADVAARPGWSGVTAVRTQRIYAVDTNLVSRPGPRLVEALEEFARIIHPELFP